MNTFVDTDLLEKEEKKDLAFNEFCDCCGARAKVRVEFTFGVLTFCDHHYRKYNLALQEKNPNVMMLK